MFLIKSILLSFKLKMVKQTKSRLRSRSRQPKRSRRQRSKKSRRTRRSRHSRSHRNTLRGGVSDFTKGTGAGVGAGVIGTSAAGFNFLKNQNKRLDDFIKEFNGLLPCFTPQHLSYLETKLAVFQKNYTCTKFLSDLKQTKEQDVTCPDKLETFQKAVGKVPSLMCTDKLLSNLKQIVKKYEIVKLKQDLINKKPYIRENESTQLLTLTTDYVFNKLYRIISQTMLTLPPILSDVKLSHDIVLFIKALFKETKVGSGIPPPRSLSAKTPRSD